MKILEKSYQMFPEMLICRQKNSIINLTVIFFINWSQKWILSREHGRRSHSTPSRIIFWKSKKRSATPPSCAASSRRTATVTARRSLPIYMKGSARTFLRSAISTRGSRSALPASSCRSSFWVTHPFVTRSGLRSTIFRRRFFRLNTPRRFPRSVPNTVVSAKFISSATPA